MSGFDVVTMGETLLRMAPPGQLRIEQAAYFELEAGGTESNTLAGECSGTADRAHFDGTRRGHFAPRLG